MFEMPPTPHPPSSIAECQLDVKHDTNWYVNAPSVIYLFSFLRTGTAFMVIVQFHGRFVRQYRALVIDSLWLGIMCLISLYCVYKAS